MEKKLSSTEETKEFAREIASRIKPQTAIALYGDLGSGKTTFTNYLAQVLGFTDRVQSPTFVIHRIYKTSTNSNIKRMHHLDLYRMSSSSEIQDLGLKELFESPDDIFVIEWPELIEHLLPKDCIKISFEYISENQRRVTYV